MANKNIANLGSISVPLAGAEVIPIWNGTTTTKVTVANLTADRSVDGLSFAAGTATSKLTITNDAVTASGTDDNVNLILTSKGTGLIINNGWKILAGDFVVVGGYPQNQILVGPATTKVFATNSAADSIANATATILKYNSEVFDTLSEFVNGTGIFTARNAGYYQITASALSASVAWGIGERWEIQIFKNGTLYMGGDYSAADAASTIQRGSKVSAVVYMNGTTDTLDSRVVHNQGGPVLLDTAPTQNTIQIIRVS